MVNNLKVFESMNKYGNMNTAARFYPEGMSAEERKALFLERRLKLGRDQGFDGHYMFMADQNTKDGSYKIIDKEVIKATDDGWKVDTAEDILIVSHETPGVAIGHPVADCPVVMASDKNQGVTAIGHCSADLIDKKMPIHVIEALKKQYGSTLDNVMVYVSACAGKSWTYDSYPKWAENEEVWEDAIKLGEDGIYHIDLKTAMKKQFNEIGLKNVIYNPTDTITSSNYYSNSAARNDASKSGRNYAGAFYKKTK